MTTKIITGDARTALAAIPDGSIQCTVTSPPYFGLRSYLPTGHDGKHAELGAEPTLAEYVANLVAVFREVRRVLRDDGTLWLNLGDSYCSHDPGGRRDGEFLNPGGRQSEESRGARNKAGTFARGQQGLKPKDLMMVPARVALALQDDGWYLRSKIIWHKPNPMPESCRDRPTSSYEEVFLLTKRARYYYDADAIAEPGVQPDRQRNDRIGGANGHTVRHSEGGMIGATTTRNARNVWTIVTSPYAAAHFATFPPELPRRCILAGTSERGGCPACGAPWTRVVGTAAAAPDLSQRSTSHYDTTVRYGANNGGNGGFDKLAARMRAGEHGKLTTGWSPSCACDAGDPVPQTVLDPFSGAGTTGLVADRLGRHYIGIELNPEYVALAEARIRNDAPMFAEVTS